MKIFLFYFEIAIKITGSALNYRVGRVSGNTPIFRPYINSQKKIPKVSPLEKEAMKWSCPIRF